MITKTTMIQYKDKPWVLEFPELETVNIGDPEIQAQLIKWGFAVGMPGGEILCTKRVILKAVKS